VIFDLDGVLVDTEQQWDRSRRELTAEVGGHWSDDATAAMQGMSSIEWSTYMRRELGVMLDTEQIVQRVVQRLTDSFESGLPLLPGAVKAVRQVGAKWPLALASSANRVVIDKVLEVAGLATDFAVTVSSEEVARGKPNPDVYIEAARRLGQPAWSCIAVEDSTNGIRSALAAGMTVVAIPNPHFPPPATDLTRVRLVLHDLASLEVEALLQLDPERDHFEDRIDEEEAQSFPASDPHSDWAGPAT
jgi:HAD superfamily hydrolase (TIGR01509 family)